MNNYFIAFIALSSCVSFESPSPSSKYFSHLQERELSKFERVIAFDVHRGQTNDRTKLAKSWLAFSNCNTIPKSQIRDSKLAFFNASLLAESARRDLRIILHQKTKLYKDTLANELLDPQFFNRKKVKSDMILAWPGGDEYWGDESPASINIEDKCNDYIATLGLKKIEIKKEKITPSLTYWENLYYAQLQKLLEHARAIPEKQRKGSISNTIFRANLDAIRYFSGRRRQLSTQSRALRIRRESGNLSPSLVKDSLEKNNQLQIEVRDYHTKIAFLAINMQHLVPANGLRLPPSELAVAQTVLAMLAVDSGNYKKAKDLLKKLNADFNDSQYAWLSRYLDLRVLSALGEFETISKKYDNTIPKQASKYYGPYVYRLALALKYSGDEERFYGIVKTAFRDKPYKSDPFLRALYFELLRSLAAVPYEKKVSEVIEELGPRGETFERVEELARVALDEGFPQNAKRAAQWLLEQHKNAKFHPRYHAIIALSAFQNDDEKQFKEALQKVIYRSELIKEAITEERRPAFFKHADVELTRVLQHTIPEMAEWGDSKKAKEKRQKWLAVIVKLSQEFLHNDPRSLARNQLLDLYRLASGLLKNDARGYAERVGETKKRPLVLGKVHVNSRELDAFEPGIDLGIPIVFSTTSVPSDSPIDEWRDRWPLKKEGAEHANN